MGDQPRFRVTFHKRIRLERARYAEPSSVCSITVAVKDRRPVFSTGLVADAAVEVLRDHARKTRILVYAYFVMPDHIHLVLSPSEACDLVTFVGQFKNLAQRSAWALGVQDAFWQTSFWDHFLRRDEDIHRVVQYVLHNPVRKGLVTDYRDYQFSGSMVFEV